MKLSTSIIALIIIVLVVVFWLALTTQDVTAPEEVILEPETELQTEENDTSVEENETSTEEFGTDIEMEFPIPDEVPPVADTNPTNSVTFAITGENFAFFENGVESPDLRVKKGSVVTIEFTSTSGVHDFVIDELGVQSAVVRNGEKTTITFEASESGTFEYYCSIGSHRANGMVGKLIVE